MLPSRTTHQPSQYHTQFGQAAVHFLQDCLCTLLEHLASAIREWHGDYYMEKADLDCVGMLVQAELMELGTYLLI